jgi:hypothetical protein
MNDRILNSYQIEQIRAVSSTSYSIEFGIAVTYFMFRGQH